jgi:hypothetical protein
MPRLPKGRGRRVLVSISNISESKIIDFADVAGRRFNTCKREEEEGQKVEGRGGRKGKKLGRIRGNHEKLVFRGFLFFFFCRFPRILKLKCKINNEEKKYILE